MWLRYIREQAQLFRDFELSGIWNWTSKKRTAYMQPSRSFSAKMFSNVRNEKYTMMDIDEILLIVWIFYNVDLKKSICRG